MPPLKKKKVVSQSQGIVLPGPDELNIPPDSLGQYAICLYGRKGIGKTSLAGAFPGAIIGQLEAGRKNLRVRQYTLAKGWEETLEFIAACLADDTVQTIVLDTIDKAYEQCLAYECYNRGIKDPNDANDYGATWRAIKDAFNQVLNTVREADKALLVLSHEQARKVKVRYGDEFDEIEPSCSKGARQWIEEACDIVAYYHYHEKKRAISIRPIEDANMEAFCSCGPSDHFLDPAGVPVSMFHVANDLGTNAYRDFEKAFHNKLWDAVRGQPSKRKKSDEDD